MRELVGEAHLTSLVDEGDPVIGVVERRGRGRRHRQKSQVLRATRRACAQLSLGEQVGSQHFPSWGGFRFCRGLLAGGRHRLLKSRTAEIPLPKSAKGPENDVRAAIRK